MQIYMYLQAIASCDVPRYTRILQADSFVMFARKQVGVGFPSLTEILSSVFVTDFHRQSMTHFSDPSDLTPSFQPPISRRVSISLRVYGVFTCQTIIAHFLPH